LQRLCGEAYDLLYEGEHAALPALGTVWRRVTELADIDQRFRPYLDARESVKSQLEDLAYFLRSYAGTIDASPARLQEVEDRLAALERLKKKHGPSLADVISTGARLGRELHEIEHATERLAEIESSLADAREGYLGIALALSKRRRAAAQEFSRA